MFSSHSQRHVPVLFDVIRPLSERHPAVPVGAAGVVPPHAAAVAPVAAVGQRGVAAAAPPLAAAVHAEVADARVQDGGLVVVVVEVSHEAAVVVVVRQVEGAGRAGALVAVQERVAAQLPTVKTL